MQTQTQAQAQARRAVGVAIDRLDDDALFDTDGLRRLLQLRATTIRHARQSGALVGHRQANRMWYSGRSVKAWLLGGTNDA